MDPKNASTRSHLSSIKYTNTSTPFLNSPREFPKPKSFPFFTNPNRRRYHRLPGHRRRHLPSPSFFSSQSPLLSQFQYSPIRRSQNPQFFSLTKIRNDTHLLSDYSAEAGTSADYYNFQHNSTMISSNYCCHKIFGAACVIISDRSIDCVLAQLVKGLSSQEFAARNDLVLSLPERIQAIPDGTPAAPKQTGGCGASASRPEIKFDSDGRFEDGYFEQTKESSQFREEYEMPKIKQDQGLDVIAEGLDTLKNMAHDMNEEFDKQVPLMDEIDTKVDKASSDLKYTNVKLKDTVTQLRSSRNFCIDIVLLIIILGIAAYLYKMEFYVGA
ncbi:unnamed protein product [Trifolium pratense]|uniref:Uncharacterized protein n=1 Tax=Trifolium pratense TaxID=57577 RepID=A0ACB0KSI1_TRIPR|nr:unnamed protein product [Trifolium pratense]